MKYSKQTVIEGLEHSIKRNEEKNRRVFETV